ncbi:MAG: excinuclease ABC subunit UvrA [Bacilli bacterium]|nr:excinuclease ABC subunit UvrA [Bacilli bacterium]MDY6362876.1 excinuclease ABC subunit UvrA [Bacilli bacterium]
MEPKTIFIKGARENNLKNIDLEIPKNALVVFTGLSGSGKTTLAFDTIFNEGQRRFVESLSSYARQFLGGMEKPDVDSITGLSPAISIDQKTTSHNPRSTVGTVTEIYDYLRLLFARVGVPYCPTHNKPIISFSISKMADIAMQMEVGTKLQILSPVAHNEKGTHKDLLAKLKQNGFERVRIDKEIYRIDEAPELEKNKRHDIEIVVDRIVIKPEIRGRIAEACELACDWSKGYCVFLTEKEERLFSQHHSCPECGFSVPKLEPRLFSFNAPLGCCPDCKGLGMRREASREVLVPDESLSINQGGIRWFRNMIGSKNIEWQEFAYLCKQYKIDLDKPIKDFTEREKEIIFNGSDKEFKYELTSVNGNVMHRQGFIEGIQKRITRLYNDTGSEMMREWYEYYMRDSECPTCHGSRLSKEALSVKVNGLNIYEVTCLSIEKLVEYIHELPVVLKPAELEIAQLIIKEIDSRATFLCNVGLNYLTLSRMAMTLSGGEAQRIRLATQIGSKLSGILYVLDEPSIGLHQRDNDKLIATMKDMVNLGNTLIVVEHDEDTMRAADFLVDIGPGPGVHGGEVVAKGSVEDLEKEPRSITGQYLSGKKKIEVPSSRRPGNGKYFTIKGAACNNLKKIDVKIPLGKFVAITGVSGSGKSSLINQTLYPILARAINKNEDVKIGKHTSFDGLQYVDKVVNITQEPIGRTPRSNPATYVGVFDDIRALFAETVEARSRGFDKGRFSFNVPGGRCETCQGAGVTRIPMNFLPDVYVKCDDCGGKRYNEETLEVTYKGKNIYEILEMTIEDACKFFENRPSIMRKLQTLSDVGLGYIKLGQQATTLSGGEAQRVKLAYELQKRPTGKSIFILDEPTTGLHSDDVSRLIKILNRIVDHGDTVVIIEHNLDVIKVADHIIDLGPEGGDKGGTIVAQGTPEEVAKVKKSYTGQYLAKILGGQK